MATSDNTSDSGTSQSRRPHNYNKIDCTCPVCGKQFKLSPIFVQRNTTNCCSVACRGVLYAKQLAVNRVQFTCEQCGKEFFVPQSHAKRANRFCSKECLDLFNYKKSHSICPTCGIEFQRWNTKQKYCSLVCRPGRSQEGGKVEHECLTCGKIFTVGRSVHAKGQGVYCSRKCFAIDKVKTMNGIDYIRGRGGKREDLGDRYFRSMWEANYARYLNWLIAQGIIQAWDYECHTFVFHGVTRGQIAYTPDFKVIENDGTYSWHEIKGWMDAKSKAKLKRMEKFYPDEKIIVIGEDEYRSIAKWAGLIGNWERASKHAY